MGESKMEAAKPLLTFLAVATFFFADVDAASKCTYRSLYFPYNYFRKYCVYGCCSSGCCSGSSSSSSAGTSVFLIVAGVVGGIVALSVLVALVCCCIKTQGKSGRVVQPASQRHQVFYNRGATNVSLVHAGGYMAPPQSQYNTYLPPGGPLSGPPPYKPYEQPPLPYVYPDPAYPPGANSNPSQPRDSGTSPGFSQPTAADPFAANGGFSQPGASPNTPSGSSQPSAPPASPFDVTVGSSQPPRAGFSQPPPPGFNVGPASARGNVP